MNPKSATSGAQEEDYLVKLQHIQHNLVLMSDLARLSDFRYNEIQEQEGKPNLYKAELFNLPASPLGAHKIASNVIGYFSVVGQLQAQARRKGARTREAINALVLEELEEILAMPDFRKQTTPQFLKDTNWNVDEAIKMFGDKMGYLEMANTLWNQFQYARVDAGLLAKVPNTNLAADLTLYDLMKDWDQVLVAAEFLLDVLVGERMHERTQEILRVRTTQANGTISDLSPDAVVSTVADHPKS